MVSFVISLVAGSVIGAPIGLSRFTTRSLLPLPLTLLAYSIPPVMVQPLFVLWFGIGSASKIAFGISHGIFPIILNVIADAQTIDEAHLKAARSMGATRAQILRRLVLPHMTPSLLAGLGLGMSATLLGVLLAEFGDAGPACGVTGRWRLASGSRGRPLKAPEVAVYHVFLVCRITEHDPS